ncbi:hypothetical protein [Eubacterium sp.]
MAKLIEKFSESIKVLNDYRNLYHAESSSTEQYKIANAINDILPEFCRLVKSEAERHAHWEQPSYFDEENGVFHCSNCKEEFVLISGSPKENGYEYCPHCGYKMDGAIHRCGDCTFIDTDCKDCVDEDETFSEVGGCRNFIKKEE